MRSATRPTGSLLDVILTDIRQYMSDTEVTENLMGVVSDHYMVSTVLHLDGYCQSDWFKNKLGLSIQQRSSDCGTENTYVQYPAWSTGWGWGERHGYGPDSTGMYMYQPLYHTNGNQAFSHRMEPQTATAIMSGRVTNRREPPTPDPVPLPRRLSTYATNSFTFKY